MPLYEKAMLVAKLFLYDITQSSVGLVACALFSIAAFRVIKAILEEISLHRKDLKNEIFTEEQKEEALAGLTAAVLFSSIVLAIFMFFLLLPFTKNLAKAVFFPEVRFLEITSSL